MQSADRIHALDAVRSYALILGVVLHSAVSFIKGFPMPVWFDQPSTTSAIIFYVVHMFRMSAFYLMAGFFARMVVERRGVKSFVKDRAKRIGIPLLALPIIYITLGVGLVLGALSHGLDFLQSLAGVQTSADQLPANAQNSGGGITIDLLHLWFLYYLAIFYACVMGIRTVFNGVLDCSGRIRRVLDTIVLFLMKSGWTPVLLMRRAYHEKNNTITIEPISKRFSSAKLKADRKFQPQEYWAYFED